MTTQQPTQEQIKEFWEWCGWKLDSDGLFRWWYAPEGGHLSLGEEPAIDLNNLFKYAVPKIRESLNGPSLKYPFHDFMKRWAYAVAMKGDDAALALFWAIWAAAQLDMLKANFVKVVRRP